MPRIRRIAAAEPLLLKGLADLLRDSVHGGASVGFLAPLPETATLDYWRGVYANLGDALLLWVAEADRKSTRLNSSH